MPSSPRSRRLVGVLAVLALVAVTLPVLSVPRTAAAVSWTQVQNVSRTPNANSLFPRVGVDSAGGVHVVWLEDGQVFYSTNRNSNWPAMARRVGVVTSDPEKQRAILTDNLGTGNSGGPDIAVDGDDVHLVWSNFDTGRIMYARYNGSGVQTIAPTSIGSGNVPRIAARGSMVAVVWQVPTLDVHYRASSNAGGTWGVDEVVSTGHSTAFGQSVAIDLFGNPHVAFGGINQFVYVNDRATGGWLGTRFRGEGRWPRLAADNTGSVFLVYQGSDAGIHFSRGQGDAWGDDRKVTPPGTIASYPSLAWDSETNGLHAVWQAASPSGFSVYLSSSTDLGNTWGTVEAAGSHAGAKDVSADIAASNGNLNLVYAEAFPRQFYEVWYQCTTCDNGTGGGLRSGWDGGHDVLGATAPSTHWYFAEGGTGAGLDEYLTLGNPGTAPATVTVTYFMGTDGVVAKGYSVPGKSRYTLKVREEVGDGKQVSLEVDSTQPIVAERPLYFSYGASNWTGGSVTMGASSPATSWYFAEGYTATGFQENLVVFNPGSAAANLTVTYLMGPGSTVVKTYLVSARSRLTIDVNGEVGSGQPVSARVDSTQPVVAERSMYFDFSGWTGGHVVMGATAPATVWYFAEGYTGTGFREFLTLQNPNPQDNPIIVTYMLADGTAIPRSYVIPADSRFTVDVNAEIGANHPVSTRVQSTLPIVAERPMYFDFHDRTGGSAALGALDAATTWYFAEGYTGSGFQEYLTLQNPGSTATDVVVTYLMPNGVTSVKTYPVGASSRRTVDVNVEVGPGQAVSMVVQSSQPIVAERSMYFYYVP